MDKTIKDLLSEEIEAELGELAHLEITSDAKSKAIDNVAKLHKMRTEELEKEIARENHLNQYELEKEKLADDKDSKKKQRFDKILEIGAVAGVQLVIHGLSSLWYNKWFKQGLKFEETGTVNTPQTRNLISAMLPKFKR